MISFEIYIVGQAAYVVVGLDHCGFTAKSALYHIRDRWFPCTRKSTAPIFFASSSNTRMNSSPMIFLLCSGSGYTCQLAVETLLRIDTDKVQVIITVGTEDCFYLVALVLTEQAVIYKDTGQLLADCLDNSTAATEESTPPDNAQRTLPLPTFSRIALIDSSTKESIFQSPQHPQILRTKLYSILEPSTVWSTSGWNWIAYSPRSTHSAAATGSWRWWPRHGSREPAWRYSRNGSSSRSYSRIHRKTA